MFKRRFQCGLCWNQVKYARITITHVCFIALTLAGSLGRCLNTRPSGLVFKQLPRDPANVNAWKNMCDPYNRSEWDISKPNLLCPCSHLMSSLVLAVRSGSRWWHSHFYTLAMAVTFYGSVYSWGTQQHNSCQWASWRSVEINRTHMLFKSALDSGCTDFQSILQCNSLINMDSSCVRILFWCFISQSTICQWCRDDVLSASST